MTVTVFAVFVPPPSGFPGGVLLSAHRAVVASLAGVPAGPYAIVASFTDRDDALRAVFAAASSVDREAGRVTFVCADGDDDRAWRLAIGLDRDLVPHTIEVLASPGFMDGYALPPGVGAFRAPGHGHGNEAHVLVDYR